MFYDRLMENWKSLTIKCNDVSNSWLSWLSNRDNLYNLLKASEIFDIENVSIYLHQHKYIDLVKDLPNVRPCFTVSWYEFKVLANDGNFQLGLLSLEQEDKKDETLESSTVIFLEGNRGNAIGGWVHWHYDYQGTLENVWLYDGFGKQECREKTLKYLNVYGLIEMWLANCFLHCKNIVLKEMRPPNRLNKARIKKGKRPLITYKVLDVRPIKRVLETEGMINEVGLKRALHICRGHFKDYTDKGLFGKLYGLYWWDAHIRGDIKKGIAMKDYRIHTE